MRFIIMHRTNAHWESGAIPDATLIARVGDLIAKIAAAGALEAGEGLRPSSEGVRLRFAGGAREIVRGPFRGGNELPAAFTIVRAGSIEEAIEWASQQATVLGDAEIDIRPVNEAWDIGLEPVPANLTSRRYMILRKATAQSEAGVEPSGAQRQQLSKLIDDATRAGMHLATETMRPSARGRRYLNTSNGISVFDGPFVESKELIGGYVIVSAATLDEAGRWADMYVAAVGASEVDLRELE